MASRLLAVAALLVLFASASARFYNAEAATCGLVYEDPGAPTTRGLSARYTGLCYIMTGSEDCPASWNKFEEIILSRDPYDFTWHDFDPLFEIVHTQAPPEKATFWARAGKLVHRLSAANKNYVTLEDTFPAGGLDHNQFCATSSTDTPSNLLPTGKFAGVASDTGASASHQLNCVDNEQLTTTHGISTRARSWEYNKPCRNIVYNNATVSPTPMPPNTTYYEFTDTYGAWWQAASLRFAHESFGSVNVVYEVDKVGPTYCPAEFFGSIELPAFNTSRVTGLKIMIATHPDNVEERCDSGSFVLLRQMAETHFADSPNFKFECFDDPYDLTLVRCADIKQSDPYCEKLLSRFNTDPSTPPSSSTPTFSPTTDSPSTPGTVSPSTVPNNINPFDPPTATQCGAHCLSKTTFKFLLVGVSLATFLAGILTTVVVQTILAHYKRSTQLANGVTPSASMKEVRYMSLLEDGLQGAQ